MSKKMKEENGVTLWMLILTLLLTVFVMLLALPNIYLDNQIYYESRELNHLNKIKVTLQEEQDIIKNRLEIINARENLQYSE